MVRGDDTPRPDPGETLAGDRLDEDRLGAWRALLNAHAAVTGRIEADLAAAGRLPLHWYDVLVALREAPGERRRLHDLARAVTLSRSGLTRLVDRLEAAGLLRRERAAIDRRGAYAVLTEAGLAALDAAWPVYAAGIRAHWAAHLSPAEARTLRAALERIDAAAGAET